MRIEIDATSLLLRSAGIKNYTYHWIRHLQAAARTGDRVTAFPFLGELGDLNHDGSNLGRTGTLWRIATLYAANNLPLMDSLVRGADVFHASNQIRKPPERTPLTATVHDLTCWLMPELHTEANVRADKSFADHVLKRARGLIAVSENTRRDAVQMLNVKPESVRTIYSGIPETFFDAEPAPKQKPYILFVGTIEPRKNLDVLLDAYAALRDDLKLAFDLIVAGPAGWASTKTMARLRSKIPGVVYRGYVAEKDLPGLTAAASVFAYPSLYEGFGFPVAQAMAARVAVLTSNTSCLPEIAGPGALCVDPRSPEEITRGLETLLESAILRDRLGRAGREFAERYRWGACAAQSWDFFRQIAGS
ncbi:MAG TPA: glycosyltransferase family 1 protein [Bryobacteraceae bacterium]|jgi:alpha-1,3-rhamnosyl/mannosyltransferase